MTRGRQGRGMAMHGATPARYQSWLAQTIAEAAARPFFGTPMVCINAWNEWAEGAYLEPDQHFGAAFLNATGRAIGGGAAAPANGRLLLIGHDAFAAGAQLLLLNIGRRLRAVHGVPVEFVLCGGGALEAAYRAVAPVSLAETPLALAAVLQRLRRDGYRHALVNSAASAWCCPVLHAHGIQATLLVHEMPVLLAQRGLVQPLRDALGSVGTLLFAAEAVRQAVGQLVGLDGVRTAILPQGIYQDMTPAPAAARRLRRAWGLQRGSLLAVGMGHADLRKGFDLFLQVWRLAAPLCPHLHMVWVGSLDPGLRAWLGAEIDQAEATGRFRVTGWREDVAAVLQAADLLLLTSREDGYPSVALEALASGVRVVAFEGSGGIPDLLRRLGIGDIVPMADCAAMAALLASAARPPRAAAPADPFSFATYVTALLALIWPNRPTLSVIVTCYRQAALLPRRLETVFSQTVAIEELVLWDDASDDGSVESAVHFAAGAGRIVEVVRAARNSGSPFGHWREAVTLATGDLVWIAEADDTCEPDFLARLAPLFQDANTVMAFCDSRPVDVSGAPRPELYRNSYEAVAGPDALRRDEVFEGRAFVREYLADRNVLFNVSAVIWRRAHLLAALERLGDELPCWRVAGDWRLYVEVLTGGGRIAYVAQAMNLHCRGDATASARVPMQLHLDEIASMHRIIRERVGPAPGLVGRQARYLKEAAAHLGRDAG